MDEQRCRWHRRRPAQATCITCSSRVCKECTALTRVGVKCRGCAGTAPSTPWGRIASIAGSVTAAVAVAVVLVILVVHSHGTDGGAIQRAASTPTPTAAAPLGPLITPVPCVLDHQTMC